MLSVSKVSACFYFLGSPSYNNKYNSQWMRWRGVWSEPSPWFDLRVEIFSYLVHPTFIPLIPIIAFNLSCQIG